MRRPEGDPDADRHAGQVQAGEEGRGGGLRQVHHLVLPRVRQPEVLRREERRGHRAAYLRDRQARERDQGPRRGHLRAPGGRVQVHRRQGEGRRHAREGPRRLPRGAAGLKIRIMITLALTVIVIRLVIMIIMITIIIMINKHTYIYIYIYTYIYI